ncbi:MAG: Sir2 family NAD-dependent protein deacetylase [Candidatus Pacearchaeota archaeon]|jgi:NAD-dependent deacetylase|nr:NAD-dependent deacylase [Clostridia bacterium]
MEKKQKLVFITGAGISKESGIDTYRDKGGLWEKYDPAVYANIRSWHSMKDKMNEFYNERRKDLESIKPNSAHFNIVRLEKHFDVHVITQNVDDLHERAGSTNILHIHGELTKIRKDQDPVYVLRGDNSQTIDIGYAPLDLKERPDYRPAVVFFGEAVPKMHEAAKIVRDADIVVVVGTSLQVYPAASLLDIATTTEIYLIDPAEVNSKSDVSFVHIQKPATSGVIELMAHLNAY